MTVISVSFVLLAVFGLTELIGMLICRFTSCKSSSITLTAVIKDESSCELAVRGIIEKLRWSRFSPEKILLITADFSEEALSDIRSLISEYPNIELRNCALKDCKFPI